MSRNGSPEQFGVQVTGNVKGDIPPHLNTKRVWTPGHCIGADRKIYPQRWPTPEEREWLTGRVHFLRHHDGLSVRQIVAALALQHNVFRSVGTVSTWLSRYRCDHCSGAPNRAPEHPERG